MAVAERGDRRSRPAWIAAARVRGRWLARLLWRGLARLSILSSLTRRILALNLVGIIVFVIGILYLNQFRAGLIDARIESLKTQGEIIASAVSASAQLNRGSITLDLDQLLKDYPVPETTRPDDQTSFLDFQIDPERVTPVLRRLVSPTKTRARIYDRDGFPVVDSRSIWWREEQAARGPRSRPGFVDRILDAIVNTVFPQHLPVYTDTSNGRDYEEVAEALGGGTRAMVRRSKQDELIVSVAVPIMRQQSTIGALLLSTQGGDIDAIVHAERMGIFRVFLVAASVMILMSLVLAGTIAGPLRRLSAAADRVRRSVKAREEIPDFSTRQDEIGHLSRAFRDMTSALYLRIDAIEHFAADVAHELKNPLTSLRSAVETLPLAKTEQSRGRLLEVIQHDVRRLDRLISDISDASRLDAELAREDAAPVDMAGVVEAVISVQRDLAAKRHQKVRQIEEATRPGGPAGAAKFTTLGHDSRLGQVLTNLIDNARSFSPDGAEVRVELRREGPEIVITVDDDGPGITPDALERIFERFYTDRPESEGFGNNSGLGLAISRQIVEAHRGTLTAENRYASSDPARCLGARFTIRLPAA